ncbi:hypothetical protein DFJ74DRAFT_195166 [Hyaloraphidium curvatum]|nr:hypothetical protein DFJ74DRAFT_195166 [Hyaloraphidium curvatum]
MADGVVVEAEAVHPSTEGGRMADPLAALQSLNLTSHAIKDAAKPITGPHDSCLELANRSGECTAALIGLLAKVQAQGISLDAEAENELRGGLERLVSAQQATLEHLASLQPRNAVDNLICLADDMRQRKELHEGIAEIQTAIQKELIRIVCFATADGNDAARKQRQEMYNLEDDLTAAGDRMEDAIDHDVAEWQQVARDHARDIGEGRENLAVRLQIPPNRLADQIPKLEDAVKTTEDWYIRSFLEKALADFRTFNLAADA